MRIVSWNLRAGGGKPVCGILALLLEWQRDSGQWNVFEPKDLINLED